MSTSNELSDLETPKLRMKPAISRIFCCSVTAASGFVAAYALVRSFKLNYYLKHVKKPVILNYINYFFKVSLFFIRGIYLMKFPILGFLEYFSHMVSLRVS